MGSAGRKTRFFYQNFPKSAEKRLFLAWFSKVLPAAQKFRPKQGLCLFSALGELGKSIWSTPKKKVDKIFAPPPRENLRSAPARHQTNKLVPNC